MIRAVLFDLDDTLYPQASFLDAAWTAVADAAALYGIAPGVLHTALTSVTSEGSDRGRIIDRALARIHADAVPIGPLVAAFRACSPARLPLYPGVREALAQVRSYALVGLVTDGEVQGQRAKVRALGLEDAFDAVVYSDDLGRAFRKPHPAPFQHLLARLGVPPDAAVMVGDRPDKDVAGAAAAGLRAIRVRTGEYADRPDQPVSWRSVNDVVAAVAFLRPMLVTGCLGSEQVDAGCLEDDELGGIGGGEGPLPAGDRRGGPNTGGRIVGPLGLSDPGIGPAH
jgi:putative hydrolase of the HAD superfamily